MMTRAYSVCKRIGCLVKQTIKLYQGMDVCYKIPSCMQRPRNDDSHLNHAHYGTSEHVFSLLPHKRRYIWNDHARLTILCVLAANHHVLLKLPVYTSICNYIEDKFR